MTRSRRSLLGTALTLLIAICANAQEVPSPAEQELFDRSNRARLQNGIAALAWDPALARAAHAHAARITQEPGELLHQYANEPTMVERASRAGAHFAVLSENLARGLASPAQVQQLWMSTPVHRANLLDPRLTAIGIAVIEIRGKLYAVEDFAQSKPALDEEEIERRVIAALHQYGITATALPVDDRTLCRDGKDLTADVLLVLQWDGPDPATLPNAVLSQLTATRYRTAAVGACAKQVQPGQPSVYRVTLLLR